MDIFTSTVGHSPETISSFIEWLLTAVVILFAVYVLKGSYQRWLDKDIDGVEVFTDTVVAMALVVLVSILIR